MKAALSREGRDFTPPALNAAGPLRKLCKSIFEKWRLLLKRLSATRPLGSTGSRKPGFGAPRPQTHHLPTYSHLLDLLTEAQTPGQWERFLLPTRLARCFFKISAVLRWPVGRGVDKH